MRLDVLGLIASLLILAAGVASASDINTIVKNCNDCHGNNGVSQWTDVPTIAGIPAVVHEDALFIYRDNERPAAASPYRQGDTARAATTMCAIAAKLSDDDIGKIAAHYAVLPFVPAKQEFNPDLASAGEAVHKAHCDRCHTDGGANPADEAGILAGQQMGYLRLSFEEFSSGTREQPKKMKEKMALLSADDKKALLHYYASQQ